MFQYTLPSVLCKTQQFAKNGPSLSDYIFRRDIKITTFFEILFKIRVLNSKQEIGLFKNNWFNKYPVLFFFQFFLIGMSTKAKSLLLINSSVLKKGRIIFIKGPRNSPINYSKT